jgi:glycosyltransferase involved in cell wall biosynthesis
MDAAKKRSTPVAIGVVSPSRNGSWLGGLYYLHHLIRACALLDPTDRPVFRDVWWSESLPEDDPFAAVRSVMGPPAVTGLPHDVWSRLSRRVRRLVKGYRGADLADVFHRAGIEVLFPLMPCERFGIPFVGWITDFQYRHLPGYYTADQWQSFEEDNRRTGDQMTLLMLSSADVAKDLRSFFPHLDARARVLRPCSVPSPDWWALDPKGVAAQHGLPDRFFLISNQICRHKNHRTVVQAARLLADRGLAIHVVCTGKTEDYRDPTFFAELQALVQAQRLEGQIRFLGALPRSEYVALLRRCLALVQPSEFEGWGFALSDAKALGKAILASNIAVHHEHNAAAARFVDPHDVGAWAEALAQVWQTAGPGPDLRAEEEAATTNLHDARRVGRELVALFDEARTIGASTG